MKHLIYFFGLALLLVACKQTNAKKGTDHKASEVKTTFKVEKLVGDLVFTEGPAVDAAGNVYFTDLRQHLILIWTLDEQLDTFRENTGRANGLYFDAHQNLLVCEGEKGQITSTPPAGESTTVIGQYNGAAFNQPNDIWPDKKGGIYFSDPKYGKDSKTLNQDGMHVYYISPDHSEVVRVCSDLEKPNGVLGTPDGKKLYVTDAQAKKTYQYDIQEDGSLANKALFVELGCDGMTIDREGNIYFTTSGKKAVDVFSPSGKLVESIDVPESPSNVCFGGKDRNELYITARTSLYRVKLDAKGVD